MLSSTEIFCKRPNVPVYEKVIRSSVVRSARVPRRRNPKNEGLTLRYISWDKYAGRWDCSVTINGEIDLATWITDNGLTKADLCPEELN